MTIDYIIFDLINEWEVLYIYTEDWQAAMDPGLVAVFRGDYFEPYHRGNLAILFEYK